MSARRVACAAVGLAIAQAALAHAALHALAAETGWVSALLSPGLHSRLAALVLGATFLWSRLTALVLLPPLIGASVGYFAGYGLVESFRPGPRSP